jgi:hypothetical protein
MASGSPHRSTTARPRRSRRCSTRRRRPLLADSATGPGSSRISNARHPCRPRARTGHRGCRGHSRRCSYRPAHARPAARCRRRSRVGGAENASPCDRDAVRPRRPGMEETAPADTAAVELEREDVALHVLHVDAVARDDCAGRQDARLARRDVQGESPDNVQVPDVLSVDAATGGRARRGEVVVRERPLVAV